MEFKNHKITEAVCAFRFDPKVNNWDITLFAGYFNSIKEIGFSKKAEIKPFALSFKISPNEAPKPPALEHGENQMVFKTDDEKFAILLAKNYISFHSLNHYPGWDVFKPKIIEEGLKKYFSLGLGEGLLSAQMIYINRFTLESDKSLSDYLSFVSDTSDFGDGEELSHLFQSNYSIAPNKKLSLKTIFNIVKPQDEKIVLLESNCIASNDVNNTIDWSYLADDAHDAARNAFVKIATEYFKSLIK